MQSPMVGEKILFPENSRGMQTKTVRRDRRQESNMKIIKTLSFSLRITRKKVERIVQEYIVGTGEDSERPEEAKTTS